MPGHPLALAPLLVLLSFTKNTPMLKEGDKWGDTGPRPDHKNGGINLRGGEVHGALFDPEQDFRPQGTVLEELAAYSGHLPLNLVKKYWLSGLTAMIGLILQDTHSKLERVRFFKRGRRN